MALQAGDSTVESRATTALIRERQQMRDSAAHQDGYKKQNKQGICPELILEGWLCGLHSNQKQDSVYHLEMGCWSKGSLA